MNAPQRAPSLFTRAEFERLVRSGGFGDVRVELRRGMIAKMSPQYVRHAAVKRLLAKALEQAISAAQLNWIVDQEVSVALGDNFQPLPDIVLRAPQSAPTSLDGPIPADAVKHIVEIADTTLADDTGEKLEDYAENGLGEYWVADVQGRQIIRHADPRDGGYARRDVAAFGDSFDALTHPLRLDTSTLS